MSKKLFGARYDVGVANEAIAAGRAIKLTATRGRFDVVDAATDLIHGVSVNSASKEGDTIEFYREGGEAVGVAGGAITVGARLSANAEGKLVANNTDNAAVIGYALEAAVADAEFAFMFSRHSV